MNTHPLLDAGIQYINKGRRVLLMSTDKIPLALCADCKPYASNPAHRALCECIKDPYAVCHSFYSATDDPAVLSTWLLNDYSDSKCMAQATGTPSNVFVVEIDPKNGGLESFEKLTDTHGNLPETEMHTSQSLGGVHYVFRMPDHMDVRNHTGDSALWPGIDIKGTGGYALLPPSEGEKGQYRVLSTAEPVQAPEWLLKAIEDKQQPRKPKGPFRVYDPAEVDAEMSQEVSRLIKNRLRRVAEAEDGTQNNTLLWVGQQLFSLCFAELADEMYIRDALLDAALEGGHPSSRAVPTIESAFNRAEADPDSVEDLLGKGDNFYKGRFTRRYTLDLPGNYSRFIAKHNENFGYVTDRGVFAAYSPRTRFWSLGNPSSSSKDKQPLQHLVTDLLFNLPATEAHLWPNEPMSTTEPEKTWKSVFDAHCAKVNSNTGSHDHIMKTLNYETPSTDGTYINGLSSHEFDNNGDVIPFRNGVLDLATGSFRQAEKDDKITIYLPWDYRKEEGCPEFLSMLERAQPDPAMRDYLQRRAGYALSVSTSEKKFWVDQGVADAGKSTVILIMDAILGPFAFSADQGLFSAGGSRDKDAEKKAGLFRKRMITLDEWDTTNKMNGQLIKAVSAGSPDNGRFLYGDPFSFNHSGKVFITTNNSVKIDLDSGIITRLVVVPWNTPITADQKRDQQELTGGQDFWRWVVEKERMGILNWMMKGYQMWRERPLSVDVPEQIQEATRAYVDNDPVKAYFFDNWTRTGDSKDKVKCSDFYKSFLESYEGDDKDTFTLNKVTQSVKTLQVDYRKSVSFGVNPETGKKEVTSGLIGIKRKES